jgi:3-carboxy-cis,cis-muconate cycloisomerase
MPASPADSQIYRRLFGDDDTAALFTDTAELRAMVLVEGALAKVQADHGLIPAEAGAFLHRAGFEVQIDPAALGPETARNGVPVPALVGALRSAMQAPEMTQWLHWGATSQDIMDSALALRLKRLLDLWQARLDALLLALADLASRHAEQPMLARTYGQAATPTAFGAVVAGWGAPLLRHRERLAHLRPDLLRVSLSGAAGTLSAMGPEGPAIRAGLARALGLHDPGESWHSQRDGIGAFAAWMAGLTASLGKMGEDVILLAQSDVAEVRLAGAGGSSTMPQKQNPVGASALVALARQVGALAAVLGQAGLHRQQRDGAAWFTEWLALPQAAILTGAALRRAEETVANLAPDATRMAAGLAGGLGLHQAEALSFALAAHMPRPEAQAKVKALCTRALAEGLDLLALARQDWPDLGFGGTGPEALGTAPAEARAFAHRVRATLGQAGPDQGTTPAAQGQE